MKKRDIEPVLAGAEQQCCTPGLTAPISKPEAEELAHLLKAVAHPVRLQLLSIIRSSDEVCACDLYAPVGLTQPTVSHHLKLLTDAGLLTRTQRGTWAWFQVNEDRMGDIREVFAELPSPANVS